ncbi:MAG: response regulator transcription factor [Spirochaetales bacterium]|jgi:LuxR family transcriptional regulator, positive regulator of biofilm formation|nr:response regulator transcription factor [Spirochaetales bacterium]
MSEPKRKVLEGHNVFIVGPLNLQNEFLLYVIEREVGGSCRIYDQDLRRFYVDESISESGEMPSLILIDSAEQSFESILKDLATREVGPNWKIALFNLVENAGVETKALTRRIQGFFYKEDSFEIFLKGIKAIFDGEIWVPRRVLLKYVYETMEEKRSYIQKRTTLTQREIEILSLVSMGATNDEIATKMYISTNTVKTHLYNIFKKIKVPNRLQAALWASKNL